MDVPAAPRASGPAWTELLHAEVAYLLREAGVRVLHIKGPTVAQWLYDAGERPGGDVDILVSPDEVGDALDVLREHGFVERFKGVDETATTDHAVAVYRPDEETGHDEVDVHHQFPGIDLTPARAFEELWRRREPAELAHTEVWFPDVPSIALLTVLNAARTRSSKTAEDLARVLRAAPEWDLVIALARRLEALPALRAGLELDAEGREIVRTTPLAQVAVSPEWRMRVADAPRTALRLDELSRLPWRDRPATVARWLFPPPAVLRMRDPAVGVGAGPVTVAYLRRIGDGVRSLPPSLRAVQRARRR